MQQIIVIIIKCFAFLAVIEGNQNAIFQTNQKNGVELIISNIRNKKGFIRIGVFRSSDGYPDKPAYNFSLAKDTSTNGQLRLFIPVDKKGLMSFTILDDENSNGKMDYILGIMPKEGFGFSNNPKIKGLKAPPFSVTCFDFTGEIKEIRVRMIYI